MADEAMQRMTPAYVTWGALEALLNHFESNGTPAQIDLAYLEGERGTSNSYAKQIVISLRFLGLIDDSNTSTPLLTALVPHEQRRTILHDTLRQTYERVFDAGVDLSHVSREELERIFREQYSISGGTAKRAATFFMVAARYAGIPLPESIADRRQRRDEETTASKKSSEHVPTGIVPATAALPATTRSENRKTITLRSAGSVSVSVVFPIFEIDKHDRDFVLDLIDRLQRYEGETTDVNEMQPQEPHDNASVDGRTPAQEGLTGIAS